MVHFVSLITSLLPISAIVATPPPKHTFKPEHSGRHKEVLNTPSEICDAVDSINVCYFLYETKRNGSENKRNKHKLGSTEGQGEGLLHSGHPATSCSGLKSQRKAWLSHVSQSAPVGLPLKGQRISAMLLTGRLK